MTLREAFGVVALVIVLQIFIGLLLYGPLQASSSLDIYTILVAIALMAAVAGGIASVLAFIFKKYSTERAMRVVLMTLTEDERRVFEAILRSNGRAYQDKLRRELDMSKSKLSALVKNLERKHAITKERYFRTNVLKVSKDFLGE
ncbi:MAG: hypothetical protein QW835_03450 [Candidatus Hadarchaeum sp.]|uniref:helix-turn-helix transcriptional regulator n=1 Tax=Candidatus Hadarchaeum sp. TaxID=2883567 RepID=UPI00317A7B5E